MTLEAGATLGPYQILDAIGAGGMGEVYRARDSRLERDVAIKVLPERLADDAAALSRFAREAKALAALSHPNLLAIFDFGTENGVAYVVTELLKGQTLRNRLLQSTLNWREAVDIGTAIAQGLAAAHSRGVVHRDLKPENVFLSSDGCVKILDFGLARRDAKYASNGTDAIETGTAVTAPETVLGTAGYMAPEQASGLPTDGRADIFSFGCLLYEMVTGRRAFAGRTGAETMAAILRDEPAQVAASGRSWPPDLERVIRRCLEKRPENRFDSARDLVFALKITAFDESAARPDTLHHGSFLRRHGRAVAAFVLTIAVLCLAAARIRRAPGRAFRFESFAVLPFAAGSDPSSVEFSDGLTQALTDRLSRLSALRVLSRSLVSRYKGRIDDPLRVGRDLNVQALLSGSVVREGERFTVTVELTDARDGRHVWGERYTPKVAETLVLEPEIAREIIDGLKFRLAADDRTRLEKAFTQDPEAYQLYLKGRYFWNAWDLDKAKEYFEKAIAKDPGYALAYAGLADTYSKIGVTSPGEGVRPEEAFPKARAAALEALKIDDKLVEAQVALAAVKVCWEHRYAEAERDLRHAIAVQPAYALSHRRYAMLLDSLRRFDEAVPEIRRAQELDPLSSMDNLIAAGILGDAGRYEEGFADVRKAEEMEPGTTHGVLGLLYFQQRRFGDALEEYRKADVSKGHDTETRADLGFACATAGRTQEAKAILAELKELSLRKYLPPHYLALVYTGLGDKSLAFDWLEKGLEAREPLLFVNADPRFDSLRSDRRFREFSRRLGLS